MENVYSRSVVLLGRFNTPHSSDASSPTSVLGIELDFRVVSSCFVTCLFRIRIFPPPGRIRRNVAQRSKAFSPLRTRRLPSKLFEEGRRGNEELEIIIYRRYRGTSSHSTIKRTKVDLPRYGANNLITPPAQEQFVLCLLRCCTQYFKRVFLSYVLSNLACTISRERFLEFLQRRYIFENAESN